MSVHTYIFGFQSGVFEMDTMVHILLEDFRAPPIGVIANSEGPGNPPQAT